MLQQIVALFPAKFSLFARLYSLLLRFAGGCELERFRRETILTRSERALICCSQWPKDVTGVGHHLYSRAAPSLGRAVTTGSTVSQKDEAMETNGTDGTNYFCSASLLANVDSSSAR